MRARRDDIEAAGASLVFVGNGPVHFAKNFQETWVPGFEVYTDPSRESYRALGLRRGLWGVINPTSLAAGWRARRAGFEQKTVEGDPLQLGGFFAVARGGELLYSHVHSSAGDRPDVDAALAALRESASSVAGG